MNDVPIIEYCTEAADKKECQDRKQYNFTVPETGKLTFHIFQGPQTYNRGKVQFILKLDMVYIDY
jgi:hypothetical protein